MRVVPLFLSFKAPGSLGFVASTVAHEPASCKDEKVLAKNKWINSRINVFKPVRRTKDVKCKHPLSD